MIDYHHTVPQGASPATCLRVRAAVLLRVGAFAPLGPLALFATQFAPQAHLAKTVPRFVTAKMGPHATGSLGDAFVPPVCRGRGVKWDVQQVRRRA